MFLYTEKDNESDKHIKAINLYYETHQRHQNTFRTQPIFETKDRTGSKVSKTFRTSNFILLIIEIP